MVHLKSHLAQRCCKVQIVGEEEVPTLSITHPCPVLIPFLRYEFQSEEEHSSNFYNILVLLKSGQIFLSV